MASWNWRRAARIWARRKIASLRRGSSLLPPRVERENAALASSYSPARSKQSAAFQSEDRYATVIAGGDPLRMLLEVLAGVMQRSLDLGASHFAEFLDRQPSRLGHPRLFEHPLADLGAESDPIARRTSSGTSLRASRYTDSASCAYRSARSKSGGASPIRLAIHQTRAGTLGRHPTGLALCAAREPPVSRSLAHRLDQLRVQLGSLGVFPARPPQSPRAQQRCQERIAAGCAPRGPAQNRSRPRRRASPQPAGCAQPSPGSRP